MGLFIVCQVNCGDLRVERNGVCLCLFIKCNIQNIYTVSVLKYIYGNDNTYLINFVIVIGIRCASITWRRRSSKDSVVVLAIPSEKATSKTAKTKEHLKAICDERNISKIDAKPFSQFAFM